MKKIITGIMICLAGSTFAQRDTTEVKISNMKITFLNDEETEEKKKAEIDLWRGFEFGVNGYFTDDNFGINNDPDNIYMELDYAKSLQFNWNIYEYNTGLGTEKVRFTTGLGFRFGRYAFKNSSRTLSFNDTVVFASLDSLKQFDKNFFNTSYLSVPLMFSVVPGKQLNKSFHLTMGAIVNYRIGSRTKQVYELNGQKRKDINRGHFHLNPFLLDLTLRAGAGGISVYTNLGVTGLFEKGKGPDYMPFSAGVSFTF